MRRFVFLRRGCLAFCLLSSLYPLWAFSQESDLSDIQDPSVYLQDLRNRNADEAVTPTSGQSYLPYPPNTVYQVPPTNGAREPWYRRILKPKQPNPQDQFRFSVPINQAPRVEKDSPKQPAALPDPLIRLAKGLTYDGQNVLPGLYLLKLNLSDGKSGFLELSRQSQRVFSVPITVVTPITPSIDTRKADKNAPKPEAKGQVMLAEDGLHVKFHYETEKTQYDSDAIEILSAWR